MLLWQSDSRAVAAAACTISLRAQEGKKGGRDGKKKERERERSYPNMEPVLLNVSVVEKFANHLF